MNRAYQADNAERAEAIARRRGSMPAPGRPSAGRGSKPRSLDLWAERPTVNGTTASRPDTSLLWAKCRAPRSCGAIRPSGCDAMRICGVASGRHAGRRSVSMSITRTVSSDAYVLLMGGASPPDASPPDTAPDQPVEGRRSSPPRHAGRADASRPTGRTPHLRQSLALTRSVNAGRAASVRGRTSRSAMRGGTMPELQSRRGFGRPGAMFAFAIVRAGFPAMCGTRFGMQGARGRAAINVEPLSSGPRTGEAAVRLDAVFRVVTSSPLSPFPPFPFPPSHVPAPLATSLRSLACRNVARLPPASDRAADCAVRFAPFRR